MYPDVLLGMFPVAQPTALPTSIVGVGVHDLTSADLRVDAQGIAALPALATGWVVLYATTHETESREPLGRLGGQAIQSVSVLALCYHRLSPPPGPEAVARHNRDAAAAMDHVFSATIESECCRGIGVTHKGCNSYVI